VYRLAIQTAADLCDDTLAQGLSNEYVRGQCELLADLFGRPGVDMGVRKDEILNDMRRASAGN
jgi:hypothetical protein